MYESGYLESLCQSIPPKDFSRHPHGEFTALVRTVKAGESQNGKPFHEIVLETTEGSPKPVRVWGFSKSDEQLAGHDDEYRGKVVQQIQITKGQLVRWGLCTAEHIANQGWKSQGGVIDQLASMIGRSFRISVGPDRRDAKYDSTEIIEMIPGVLQTKTVQHLAPPPPPPPAQKPQQQFSQPQQQQQQWAGRPQNLSDIPF